MAHNPKNELSPKFIFWFWFIPAFCFWIWINFVIFQDGTVTYPELDANGIPVDPEMFQRYLMVGEQSKEDFPFWSRVLCSAMISAGLFWWGIQLQIEMWIFRKVTRVTRKIFK